MSFLVKLQKKLLKFDQKLITRQYNKHGLTDEILNVQLKLNEVRNRLDLDESDDEFIQ